jgi:hypothetical protein
MIGGLLKSSSRLALAAAAGLFVGGVALPSAKAADLGGDCCADLEERVAELEATTARKGNRKMSLTISGQVNRIVTWYDDGKSSATYYGLDNTNNSSRFIFNGSAKVTPKVTMGFEIMIEIEAGGTSSKVSQLDEDGKLSAVGGACATTACPLGTSASFNPGNVDAYFGDARRVAWWMEHADLGRLTVGRWEGAGVLGTIDLTGNLYLPASASFVLLNGGYWLRGPSGQFYRINWSNIGDPASNNPSRTELVRYDSPSWHGFIYSASIAEAGDYWGTMIRYANEFQGFRLAGTVGYERVADIPTPTSLDPTNIAYSGNRPDITVWGFALSAMHVPTGLFVQGHYNHADFGGNQIGGASGYWGESTTNKKPADHWLIQAGIAKNWFGYGQTAFYGEYGIANDWGADFTTNGTGAGPGRNFGSNVGCASPPFTGNCISNMTTVNNVTSTEMRMWGFGVTQNFSAAATDVYLGYRHFDATIKCIAPDDGGNVCGGAAATFANGTATATKTLPTEGIDVIVMGARIQF